MCGCRSHVVENGEEFREEIQEASNEQPDDRLPRSEIRCGIMMNFVLMSILFSAHHGAMVSCVAFSTLYLGSTGTWELALFHLVYALTALSGSTYVVKTMGARNSMVLGMGMCSVYVLCFWFTLKWESTAQVEAVIGAILGGSGIGLVWTAQGCYFARAAEKYSKVVDASLEMCTSHLSGTFAFIYLLEEVLCKLLSWFLLVIMSSSPQAVMLAYTVVVVASTCLMVSVQDYRECLAEQTSTEYMFTAAWQLLLDDPKMKYMIGMNAVFGFTSPFVNAYMNGEVVTKVLGSAQSVGLLSSVTSAVAAVCSLVFGAVSANNKGFALVVGATAFGMVALPSLIEPSPTRWGLGTVISIYCFQGIGRSSFEGALKGTFADFFPQEKEGAFANIILQNGGLTAVGYYIAYKTPCFSERFCATFKDESQHDTLTLELAIVCSAAIAIVGYCRAWMLHRQRQAEVAELGSPFLSADESFVERQTLVNAEIRSSVDEGESETLEA